MSSHLVERIMISYQQLCSARRLTGARVCVRVCVGGGLSAVLVFYPAVGGTV